MRPSPDTSDVPAPPPLDARRRRILFRSLHRGTYENDLLVGGFVRARIAAFTDDELDALEEVLELPDAELADWLTGRQPIPPECGTPMLRAIRDAADRGEAVWGRAGQVQIPADTDGPLQLPVGRESPGR